MRDQKPVCSNAFIILTGLNFLLVIGLVICHLFMVLPTAFIILLGLFVVSFFFELIYLLIRYDKYQKKEEEEIKRRQERWDEEIFKMNITCLTDYLKIINSMEHLLGLLAEEEKK